MPNGTSVLDTGLHRNHYARCYRGTMAYENGYQPVIPSPSREGRGIWGGVVDAPPQMLRRCGWLSMTFPTKDASLADASLDTLQV